MDISTVKAHIKSATFDDFYVFTGPEVGVMDIYIDKMASTANAEVLRADSLADVYKKCNAPALVRKRQIFVIRDDRDFILNDKIELNLTRRSSSWSMIIFIYSAIDKRSKFWKSHSDQIVVFDHLKPAVLAKYVSKEVNLSSDNISKLMEVCEYDYSRILLESDKIRRYADVYSISQNRAFAELLAEGVIYIPPEDAIFDFVDAVLRNQKVRAFQLLEKSYASGEATLTLLSVLYTSTKQVFQCQTYGGNNLAAATGLTPFQIKLATGRMDKYSDRTLVKFMKHLRELERGIKLGDVDESRAVYLALVQLWGDSDG